jgi:hypothetical protein
LAPFASIFQRCQGSDPISLYEAQRILLIQKGLVPYPKHDDHTDWPSVDQSLAETYGWTLQQIDEMTLPEIRVACKGQRVPSLAEKLRHVKLKKHLTILEKLLAMRIAAGHD